MNIPTALMEEARAVLGYTSNTDTVVLALRELIRRRRLDELKQLMGRVRLDVDLVESRRRPGRPRRQPA